MWKGHADDAVIEELDDGYVSWWLSFEARIAIFAGGAAIVETAIWMEERLQSVLKLASKETKVFIEEVYHVIILKRKKKKRGS